MKNLMRCLAVFLLLLVSSSCIADRARSTTLLPAARLAWPGVHTDIDRGVADGVADGEYDIAIASTLNLEIGRLDSALKAGQPALIAGINWMILEPVAFRGIQDRVDDGELSPAAADSFIERVWNFHDALAGLGAPVEARTN